VLKKPGLERKSGFFSGDKGVFLLTAKTRLCAKGREEGGVENY
jgi:hypothetical protein